MTFFTRIFLLGWCWLAPALVSAQESAAPDPESARHAADTAAGAAVAGGYAAPRMPDFLEHIVDSALALFDVKTSGNTPAHYAIALLFLLGAYVLRHVVIALVFGFFRKLAARTRTTLDDKLFPAIEAPASILVVILGAVAALKVLKLSAASDETLGYASTAAFSLVAFWLILRTFNTVLDHLQKVARDRQMGIAAFMPWIRKALVAIVFVFGVLLIAQSLGANVKAFLAGLGIGGLAFALAAQDTLANVFGSVVVAVDQPFKLGEFIKIGGNIGMVEDIGLRSTRLRLLDKSLIVMPNKMVAAESIINFSRFTGRRVEQVIGLTYDTTAGQMQEIVDEFRRLILAEDEVDPASVICYFRDYSASSLDIWLVYNVKDPDFHKHMALKQRLSLAFMRAVEARGLSFAFPTQTVHVASLPQAIEKSAAPAPSPKS